MFIAFECIHDIWPLVWQRRQQQKDICPKYCLTKSQELSTGPWMGPQLAKIQTHGHFWWRMKLMCFACPGLHPVMSFSMSMSSGQKHLFCVELCENFVSMEIALKKDANSAKTWLWAFWRSMPLWPESIKKTIKLSVKMLGVLPKLQTWNGERGGSKFESLPLLIRNLAPFQILICIAYMPFQWFPFSAMNVTDWQHDGWHIEGLKPNWFWGNFMSVAPILPCEKCCPWLQGRQQLALASMPHSKDGSTEKPLYTLPSKMFLLQENTYWGQS